jgi:hypothetical protein
VSSKNCFLPFCLREEESEMNEKNVYGDEEGRKSFGRTLGRAGAFFSGVAGNISSVSDVQMFCNQQMEKVPNAICSKTLSDIADELIFF